jgi:hypothetical protein
MMHLSWGINNATSVPELDLFVSCWKQVTLGGTRKISWRFMTAVDTIPLAFELCDFAVPSSPAPERDLPAELLLSFSATFNQKEQATPWRQEQ